MKHKQSYRVLTQSNNRRPISSVTKHPYLNSSYSNMHNNYDNPSEILLTTPSYSKGSGNNIEKEKLYEQTMQLKTQLNKLTKELSETKSNNVKLDIELRKRENIIKTIVEENEHDIDLTKKENMDKASESTLVSRCKREYHELKKKYYKLVAQNEFLNSNIKITKINEIKIETQILQDELIKVTDLYHHSQNQNMINDNTINDLLEFKEKFIVQHTIIKQLEERMKIQHKEIESLRQEAAKLNEQKSDVEIKDKKLKIENAALQKQIEKLSNDKKNREKSIMNQSDYEKKIKELLTKCEQYKKMSASKPANASYNQNPVMPMKIHKGQNVLLKEYIYESVKTVERIPDNVYEEKIKLLQGIIKDQRLKIKIYEAYLKSIHQDPDLILKNGNYNSGVINSKSNIESTNNNQKTSSSLGHSSQVDDLNQKLLNGKQTNHLEPNNIITNSNNNDYNYDINNYFNVLQKALEASNVTQEVLRNDLNDIYQNFENQTETTKDDFLKPFVDMFVKHYKLELQSDIESLEAFFSELIDQLDNDTEKFYETITEMFTKIIDYSNVEDMEEQLTILGKLLFKYKDYLSNSLKKLDPENTGVVSFNDMWKLCSDNNNFGLNNDQKEFLIYLMKKNTSNQLSLFSLDYAIVFEILRISNEKMDASHLAHIDDDNSEDDERDKMINTNDDDNDIKEEINSKILIKIYYAQVYGCLSFDKLFGEYITESNDSKINKTIPVIKMNNFENVLTENGILISKADLACFQWVYAINKGDELDVLKIKEDIKNIPIENIESKLIR